MTFFLNLLLIFFLRVVDVSLGTLRVNLMVRGFRYFAAGVGFFECIIWLLAAARVLDQISDVFQVVAFAGGFATGTLVGIWLNELLALGKTLMRVIAPRDGVKLARQLRESGCIVTTVDGEGRDGDVLMAFTVIPKKRVTEILELVRRVTPDAFVTFEDVSRAQTAFVPGRVPSRQAPLNTVRPRV